MIYIKNICTSNERLIVEQHVHKEQSFYKFENAVLSTHCQLCTCFFVSNNVITYIFFLNFHHEITSNIIFAVFLFHVSVCYYFTASNIKFVGVLYCKLSSAIVT